MQKLDLIVSYIGKNEQSIAEIKQSIAKMETEHCRQDQTNKLILKLLEELVKPNTSINKTNQHFGQSMSKENCIIH